MRLESRENQGPLSDQALFLKKIPLLAALIFAGGSSTLIVAAGSILSFTTRQYGLIRAQLYLPYFRFPVFFFRDHDFAPCGVHLDQSFPPADG